MGDIIKVIAGLGEQIVVQCHRSWGNREGDTAFAK